MFKCFNYILNGLNCLAFINEGKLNEKKERIKKKNEQLRIIQEESNQNLANRYKPIPLPYEKLQKEKNNMDRSPLDNQILPKSQHNIDEIQSWDIF